MKRVLTLIAILVLCFAQPVTGAEKQSLEEEIVYDILVDRFNIGHLSLSDQVNKDDPYAYHGGDLLGITKKLDRIQQLGFTTISLSPIMQNAENGYHGYWIEDFYEIDEQFGSIEDLNKLIEEAHGRGIKVILEFVTNYVSKTHPFVEDKSKQDWFKEQSINQVPATYWLDDVAFLDQDNEEVASYLMDVASYWMKETDIDGFKLNDADQSSSLFIKQLSEQIKNDNAAFYLLAGVSAGTTGSEWDKIKENQNIDAFENKSMLETMNEVFTEVDTPVSLLFDVWEEDKKITSLLFTDNKNTARFSNNFADKGRNALTTWKLALTFMYTMPDVPVLYQGSELPMYGPGFPENQHLVRFNSTDPDIEEYYDRISSLRKEFPVLSHGDVEYIGSNEAMTLYKRFDDNESMYIAINNSSTSQTLVIDEVEEGMQLKGLLGDNLVRENDNEEYQINIPRESAEVYIVEEDVGLNWFLIGFIVGVFVLFIIVVAHLSRKQKQREQNE